MTSVATATAAAAAE